MPKRAFIPLDTYREYPEADMRARAEAFLEDVRRRRSVRSFSERPAPEDVIRRCVEAAGTAPSGANQQPWHFAIVTDPDVKHRIRIGAEKEEREFYAHRASREWLGALEPLGTDDRKPFLEMAPCLIAIFAKRFGKNPDGDRQKYYYATESVGIATGILITALHHAGLATLTHTPSPMGFLNEILNRPDNERPFLLLVVGYPADGVTVPDIQRKPFDDIASFH